MQIKINLQIFLFIIIFILTHQIEIYGFIMLFAFIHEIGHMCAGIALNLKAKAITLMPFGVAITFEDYEYKRALEIKKIIIAVAGPITNLIISLVFSILNIDLYIKEIVVYANLLIAFFNLIPLYPLDGGRILKGLLRLNNSPKDSDRIINKISNILIITITGVSSIIILYIKNIAIPLIVIYLWLIVIKENKKYKLKKIMYGVLQKNNKCIDI